MFDKLPIEMKTHDKPSAISFKPISSYFASKMTHQQSIPNKPLHGLQRAHESIFLKEAVNLKIASERLGHSTIATTMDV